MKISLAGPSYTSRSVVAAAQEVMNLYPEAVEAPNEPTKLTLYGRPGIKLFKQLTGDPKIRCIWAGGGRLFVVHGNTLSEVTQAAVQTDRPGVAVTQMNLAANPNWPACDPAQIFSNGHQLMIVSGGFVFYDNGDANGVQPARVMTTGTGNTQASTHTLVATSGPAFTPTIAWLNTPIEVAGTMYTIINPITSTSVTLSGPGVPDATNVVWNSPATGAPLTGYTGGFLDGYFLVSQPPTGRLDVISGAGGTPDPGRNFVISRLLDGAWWDPSDYGVKEGASDYIHSILCDHEELYLFGTETTEVWSNVGDPNFPFQRNPGAFIHEGSSAMFAPCSVGLSVCGLAGGANGETIAFRVQGLQPQRISTHAQEQVWNSAGFVVSDATSYGYSAAGHTFWVLNFWQMARTWVYDLTTGLWHERAAWESVSQTFLRYQPWFHAFLPEWGPNGMHIGGDPITGKLYQMSTNFTDDDGIFINYRRAFPHLINENEFSYCHRLEILAEMGALGSSDPVPQITLDWSKDHGHTFVNARSVAMAASGDYTRRAVWRRLGKTRDMVPRIAIAAKVKIALIDAYLEATEGFA